MKLSNVAVGTKFTHNGGVFIKIEFNLATISLTTKFPDMLCALDLEDYTVRALLSDTDVKLYEYPTTAEWIKPTSVSQEFCSNCKRTPKMLFGMLPDFCPNCGERMSKEVRRLYADR